ncbi:MAG: hypothetical protein AAF628_07230 [Planctomycetota bacterium]
MNTTDIPIERIQTVLDSCREQSGKIHCVFLCPVSATAVDSVQDIAAANRDSLKSKLKTKTRQTAAKSVSRSVMGAVRGIFGSGVVSQIAGEAVKHASKQASQAGGFDDEEKQRAIVAAFARVQRLFKWDESRQSYVHAAGVAKLEKAAAKA